MKSILLNDNNFKLKLENATGILYFYKKMCPNCKVQEKVMEKFLSNNPEIRCFQIDSEESPEAMKFYGVERVPTIFILRSGQTIAKKVGLMNLKELQEFYQSS